MEGEIQAVALVASRRFALRMRSSMSGWIPRSSFTRRSGTSSPHCDTAEREMPNWSPKTFRLPNTATKSIVFMATELSILCTKPSRALIPPLVKLPYMGGSLRERLIEIADELANDAEFARIAKVSRSAVSQWRKGDVKALKALSAVNIQERTGYSVRWLILGVGPKKTSAKQETSAAAHNRERTLSSTDEKNSLRS
jgi:hypothetical protein